MIPQFCGLVNLYSSSVELANALRETVTPNNIKDSLVFNFHLLQKSKIMKSVNTVNSQLFKNAGACYYQVGLCKRKLHLQTCRDVSFFEEFIILSKSIFH